MPGDAPNEGHQHRHASGRRHEVLHGERRHLGEVAQRRFAAVGLPVGVGDETDGGVEGQLLFHRAHIGGIERQHALHALQQVGEDEAHDAEQQHRGGVALPVHLLLLV